MLYGTVHLYLSVLDRESTFAPREKRLWAEGCGRCEVYCELVEGEGACQKCLISTILTLSLQKKKKEKC